MIASTSATIAEASLKGKSPIARGDTTSPRGNAPKSQRRHDVGATIAWK